MEILIYAAIGITIGCLSGVLGIGGGVLIIPALVWLCHFPHDLARGTSLAILVPPIGLPAAIHYWREGKVDLAAVIWIAAAFAIGALGGTYIVKHLDELFLRLFFGLVMVFIAVRIMLASDSEAANAAAGLAAAGIAWLGFLRLRMLGRRHLSPPNIGDLIRKMEEEGRGQLEYYI